MPFFCKWQEGNKEGRKEDVGSTHFPTHGFVLDASTMNREELKL
jgi:hypothetical protein